MWEDEIVEELHRIREEHAKAFNYDIRAICADWRKRQEQSGRQFSTPLTKPASELEEAYRFASSEVDAEWDTTVADGLTNETW